MCLLRVYLRGEMEKKNYGNKCPKTCVTTEVTTELLLFDNNARLVYTILSFGLLRSRVVGRKSTENHILIGIPTEYFFKRLKYSRCVRAQCRKQL